MNSHAYSAFLLKLWLEVKWQIAWFIPIFCSGFNTTDSFNIQSAVSLIEIIVVFGELKGLLVV